MHKISTTGLARAVQASLATLTRLSIPRVRSSCGYGHYQQRMLREIPESLARLFKVTLTVLVLTSRRVCRRLAMIFHLTKRAACLKDDFCMDMW